MLTSSYSRDIDFTYPRLPQQVRYETLGPERTASPPPNKTYEYIVVGSGPGGSPLAARLALAGHSVLLIDAGADHGGAREVQIPAMSVWASERTELSWAYYTHHYEDEEQTKRDRKLTYRTKEGDLYSGKNPPPGAEMLGNYYPRVGGLGGKSAPLKSIPARTWLGLPVVCPDGENSLTRPPSHHRLLPAQCPLGHLPGQERLGKHQDPDGRCELGC